MIPPLVRPASAGLINVHMAPPLRCSDTVSRPRRMSVNWQIHHFDPVNPGCGSRSTFYYRGELSLLRVCRNLSAGCVSGGAEVSGGKLVSRMLADVTFPFVEVNESRAESVLWCVLTTCRCAVHFLSDWLCLLACVLQGCRMFTSVKAFEGQQYSTLKRQCLQSGLLFEDPRFPATDDSLFYQGNRIGRVVWKRPRVSSSKTDQDVYRYLNLNLDCF